MKRYKVIDLKTNAENFYTKLQWNLAFAFVFVFNKILNKIKLPL